MNISLTNIEEEVISEEWGDGNLDAEMSITELIELVKTGFYECPEDEYCYSRKYSTIGCRCIRQRFPSFEHYELYLTLRSRYLEMIAEHFTSQLISAENGENNDKHK